MASNGPQIEIHYAEEWAALYVDGLLDRVGDAYLAEERALELLGVTTVHDDAFMRGQSQRAGVAQTLDQVREFAQDREQRRQRAAELRAEADRLLRAAGELQS